MMVSRVLSIYQNLVITRSACCLQVLYSFCSGNVVFPLCESAQARLACCSALR